MENRHGKHKIVCDKFHISDYISKLLIFVFAIRQILILGYRIKMKILAFQFKMSGKIEKDIEDKIDYRVLVQ